MSTWSYTTNQYGAYISDLRRETVRGMEGFTFRWHAAGGDDFQQALAWLKDLVPSPQREWREETKEWWVEKDAALKVLPGIFCNFKDKLEALDLQGRLF